ncbi:MAG: FAD-dependent oxidoreductase [Candidatus Bathyarchaeota archaeon]
MPCKIIIVGNNAAGSGVVSAARKTDRDAEIIVIDKGKYPAYSRCGLPYVLAGEISSFENLITFPFSFYELMKIDLRLETLVTSVEPKENTVTTEREGKIEKIKYDSLVLATGADTFIPPIKGFDKDGVYSLRSMDDGKKIQKAMNKATSAVIIGAGFIGLEIAHAFVEKGITTTVIEMAQHILPAVFDIDMATFAHKKMEKRGVRVMASTTTKEIVGKEKVDGILVGNKIVKADMVIMATGVRANTDLAKKIGLTLGIDDRTIRVNSRMETSIPNIYAAGDCAESKNFITGLPTVCQLGTTAVRHAKVAGINAAGGYSIFPGVISSAVTKMFGFEVGATGITESQANKAGLEAVTGSLTSTTKPLYFPGGKEIKAKIIAEKEFGTVIGGQIVGGEDVAQRVNMISLAIQNRMTVVELAKADTCYAPPVAETWEPIALAAELAMSKLRAAYCKDLF